MLTYIGRAQNQMPWLNYKKSWTFEREDILELSWSFLNDENFRKHVLSIIDQVLSVRE